MTFRRPGSPAPHLLPARGAAAAAALLLAAAPSQAQQAGGAARALTIAPNASVTQTLTDNVLLDDARKRSDAVTELTVGVRLASRGRVRGFLDYQLTGSVHARESRENNMTNALRAGMNAILIDDFLFLEGAASISQQTVSAFGVQTASPSFDNRNRTEVRSYTITPSMRGLIGSWARYDVRWSHTQQSSASSELGDSTDQALSVVLSSARASRVGWSLSAVQSRSDFDAGRSTDTKHAKGTLSYRATPDLGLSASAGREWSDLLGTDTGGRKTWSLGLNWTPTERTRLNAQRERRFFGDTHALSFEHRMKHSTWRFSSSEDISTSSPSVVNAGTIALYDLLFANFTTQYPDPLIRQEKVREFLQRQNLNPNQAVPIGFLQSAVALTKRQEFGVAYAGLRTTVSLSASRSDSRRIDELATVRDDLALSGRVKQSVLSTTFGYRLNPTDSVNLLLMSQRTQGATSDQQSDLKSISLNWSGQFGIRSSLSFGARHVEFDSLVTPYTENAIFATLGVRF
jgi:uncharacterized protein (PEP-CTERM system associated)